MPHMQPRERKRENQAAARAPEVSNEMIEAGTRALHTLERDVLPPSVDRNQQSVDPRLLVSTIYTAMHSARPNPEGQVTEALKAADELLCELTPNFPDDVGPDMRDAEQIEKIGAVVMQIRAAIEALSANTVAPKTLFERMSEVQSQVAPDDAELVIFREAIKRGVDQDTADQIAQACAERIASKPDGLQDLLIETQDTLLKAARSGMMPTRFAELSHKIDAALSLPQAKGSASVTPPGRDE